MASKKDISRSDPTCDRQCDPRYGPGRQSRQQSLVKLAQLQQVSMNIMTMVNNDDNNNANADDNRP